MDLDLEGSTVFVTGGTSGIGLATVDLLLSEGANVVTCGRDAERLRAVTSTRSSSSLLGMVCDVRDPAAVDQVVRAALDRFGSIEGLVNNAGQSRMKSWQDCTWDDWRDELELKFSGVLNPLHAVLAHLPRDGRASIVNINAVLARQPETHLITTSAARAGILNLSKNLANELAAEGIRVNSILLGMIESGQWRRRFEAAGASDWDAWSGEIARDRGVPMQRFGHPDEVASVIAFLLSPVSSYLTGTAIEVSGGVSRGV